MSTLFVQNKEGHTVPRRSASNISHSATFPMMKKKPISVTIFGASHSGKNSTHAFHCANQHVMNHPIRNHT